MNANTSKVNIKHEHVVCLVNLADVAHGDLIGSKDFDDGRHIDFYEALPGTKVVAYDEVSGEPKWVDVSGWSRHTGCKIELVQLSSGDTISTDNDPRAIYGMPIDAKNLEMDRDTPSNARDRKFIVPRLNKLPVATEVFTTIDFKAGIPSIIHQSPEDLRFDADYELGEVLGIMVGDGWWNKKEYKIRGRFNWQINLSDLSGYNAEAVRRWLEKRVSNLYVYSYEYKKDIQENRYGDTIKWSYYFDGAEYFCKFFSDFLGGERDENTSGSANKRLPFWIFAVPREFRLGVLNGLIATDGSISMSHKKDRRDELIIQFGSTSRELVDDVKALCASLNITATVGFSKLSSAGNSFWYVVLSTIDCKRQNIFSRCSHLGKRETFINAVVNTDAKYVKDDVIPFPYQISDALKPYIKCRQHIGKAVVDDCPLMETMKKGASLYQSVVQYKDRGYITRDFAGRFSDYCERVIKLSLWFDDFIKTFHQRLVDGERVFPKEEVNTLVEGIRYNERYLIGEDADNACALAGRLRQKGASFPVPLAEALEKVFLRPDTLLVSPLETNYLIKEWFTLVASPMKWSYITDVIKTEQKETGYDLTVPGYETFTSDTGVVLSNTMTYYVPVSKKAVQEAYDLMLPSKNQLAARDFKALPELQEELVSGAWLASHKKNAPVKAVFNTRAEAVAAYRKGLIDVDDNVIIREDNR